ncbi:MAG: hypothetical protein ACI4Q4_10000 [Oscillospiraceae bacterium]
MTPLEKAKKKAKENKEACCNCEKSERVNGILFCNVSGKIILPRFEGICVCRGKRKEHDNK